VECIGYLCQFCVRYFSRKYNRDRHEKQGGRRRPTDKGKEMTSQYALNQGSQDAFNPGKTDEEYEKELSQDGEEQEDEYDDNEDIDYEDENEDEDESDDGGKDDDEEEDEEAENDDTDPWDKLHGEVINHLNSTWDGQVEEKVTQGLPKDVAKVEASNP